MHFRSLKTILPGMSFSDTKTWPRGAETGWRMARIIAAVFSLAVALVMLFGQLGSKAIDPLNSPEVKTLKEKLRQNPADEPLKQQIRTLDLRLRARYFRRLSQNSSGVYLLLGGVAVFL